MNDVHIGHILEKSLEIQISVRSRDAHDQLKLAKYNLEANKLEFDEYKEKTKRILQVHLY